MDINIEDLKLIDDERELEKQILNIVTTALGDNKKDIIQVLSEEFIAFASEVLINNIPTLDGCLSVNKKVLWGMYKGKVFHEKPFIKMLRASSYAMLFYVLGDMPLTNAMKNMANNNINYFYLDPKGSYGDKNKKGATGASARYIECRLSLYGQELLKGVEKNCVPTKRNYDNTEDEIIILPSVIPNILTNTSQSIAVGEASKIPSHNLISVCDSFISYIKTKDIDKSIEIIQCPDFIGIGGKIPYDKKTFEEIYKTGRGSFTLLGKHIYDDKENILSIIEIPYVTYIDDIKKKLIESYDKGLFKEIIDIHDGTDKDGLRLDIILRKNTNIDQFIKKLRKYTPYESKFSCNFTVLDLDCKTPVLMTLEDIITKWIIHRENCIIKETEYDINSKTVELHKLYGLKTINYDLDKAISIIRKSKSEKIASEELIKYFNLTEEQANYIATIRLLNINQEWIAKKVKNVDELEEEVKQLKQFKDDKNEIHKLIISQLEDIKKKFGRERATEIIHEEENNSVITSDDLIQDYNCKLFFTEQGYIKKIPLTSMRGSGEQKLKDGDKIKVELDIKNKSDILVFSNKQNCYKISTHELEDCKTSVLGQYVPSLLELNKDEFVINIINTIDYTEKLIICYNDGNIAKIPLLNYKSSRKMLQKSLSDKKVISLFVTTEDIEILLQSTIDKILITNTNLINEKSSRSTIGVSIQKQKNDSTTKLCVPLSTVDGIEDIDYYRANKGVGAYLKKTDKIILKQKQ